MENAKWNIDEGLTKTENIIYKCEVQDKEKNMGVSVILTNLRVIRIEDEDIDCRVTKWISNYGSFRCNYGYGNDYGEGLGSGEYGVYFGSYDDVSTILFERQEVCEEFYYALSKIILEN